MDESAMSTTTSTPSSSRAGRAMSASSSRLKPSSTTSPTTHSPTKNAMLAEEPVSNENSREGSPELPTSDKSDSSSGDSETDNQPTVSTPNYDAETQETAIVPDSAQASPTPSLPPLSSSAVQKMLFTSSKGDNVPLTPSQEHLAQLQNDILAENDQTLAELVVPMEEDSISLQSDLTIADLDEDNWKQLIISYGAEPRSDDEDIFDSLEPSSLKSSAARRRHRHKNDMSSARKSSRASTRNKPQTPANVESTSQFTGSLVTPARSTGRTTKTYGKRSHRASTSTSSEADTRKSQRTSLTGTTSGESDCVEVTTQRRAGVLRHVTPDGTIIPSTEVYTPSKRPWVTKKGKERAAEPPTTAEESDDDEMDLDLPDLKPHKKDKGKSPEKATHSKTSRDSRRDRGRPEKSRIRTPSLSPPPAEPAPFVPLSTAATEGKALSAMQIIAQMRARNKPIGEQATEEEPAKKDEKPQDDEDLDMQLNADLDLRKVAAAIQDDDSDDDDLVDAKTLLRKARNAPRPADSGPDPVASTSAAVHAGESKPKSQVRLPMDKSTLSLNKLFKSRQAEEARGWYGIDEASREEAGIARRSSSSTSPRLNGQRERSGSAEADYDSDASSSSSLPDGPAIPGKTATKSKHKPKRQRRHSNGQLTRVVSHLTKSKEDKGVVDAIKLAHDELEAARARARRRKEQQARLFWKQLGDKEEMTIEVSATSVSRVKISFVRLTYYVSPTNTAIQAVRDSWHKGL